MPLNDGMYSSETPEWSTPQELFDKLNDEFAFTLDPCATDENHKCEKWFTVQQDGLSQPWVPENVFMSYRGMDEESL
jgi:phage N-6-adenine-methyltransferase